MKIHSTPRADRVNRWYFPYLSRKWPRSPRIWDMAGSSAYRYDWSCWPNYLNRVTIFRPSIHGNGANTGLEFRSILLESIWGVKWIQTAVENRTISAPPRDNFTLSKHQIHLDHSTSNSGHPLQQPQRAHDVQYDRSWCEILSPPVAQIGLRPNMCIILFANTLRSPKFRLLNDL